VCSCIATNPGPGPAPAACTTAPAFGTTMTHRYHHHHHHHPTQLRRVSRTKRRWRRSGGSRSGGTSSRRPPQRHHPHPLNSPSSVVDSTRPARLLPQLGKRTTPSGTDCAHERSHTPAAECRRSSFRGACKTPLAGFQLKSSGDSYSQTTLCWAIYSQPLNACPDAGVLPVLGGWEPSQQPVAAGARHSHEINQGVNPDLNDP
jgi:hypothetical protein